MTKPKKWDYQIQYKDNTYRVIGWTKAEFQKIGESMQSSYDYCVMEEGIFELKDIRAIILLPEIPEEKPQNDKNNNKLTEWGFVDADTALWLKQMGIDLGEVEQ